MSEHTPWCCDGHAAFCPLCPRPTDLVRCPGHAYTDRNRETVRVSRLHADRAHPDFVYRTTKGPRKQWDSMDAPPTDNEGNPEPGWERNVDAGDGGWERFDHHEETHWRRPKRKTDGPCVCDAARSPGVSRCLLTCPRREQTATADTGRRCPRCDCPDGHEQCEHCKVCEHARPTGSCLRPECGGEVHTDPWGVSVQCPRSFEPFGMTVLADGSVPFSAIDFRQPAPDITIIGEDGQTPLVTIHPDGTLDYGPDYTPDEAARCFWGALRRLAPARCPNCGHTGTETP